MELAIDPVERAYKLPIKDRSTDYLAAPSILQPKLAHQPLYSAARDVDALSMTLLPHLHNAITLNVVILGALDLNA